MKIALMLAVFAVSAVSAAFAAEIAFDQPIQARLIFQQLRGAAGSIDPADAKEEPLGWSTDCKDVEMAPGQALSPVLQLVSFEVIEVCDAGHTHCRRSFGQTVSKDARLVMIDRPADHPAEAFGVCLTGEKLTVDTYGSRFQYDISQRGDDVVLRSR